MCINPHGSHDNCPAEDAFKTIYNERPEDRTWVGGTITSLASGDYDFSGTFRMSNGDFKDASQLTRLDSLELMLDFLIEYVDAMFCYSDTPVEHPAMNNDADDDEVTNAGDNCCCVPNPGQEDSDGDGIGDACQTEELVTKDGDPAYFVGFPSEAQEVIRGEAWCYDIAPTNFGFVSGTCTYDDTFCQHYSDLLGWTISAEDADGGCFIQNSGTYHWNEVCVAVPCDASIGSLNILTATMTFCNSAEVCQPESGDCEDPNIYGGNPYYFTTTAYLHVVESPPSLYILGDSLYFVEQGQTAAYVPFSICNGDPCAPTTNYAYTISNKGWIGGPSIQGGNIDIGGGDCGSVYYVIDAGAGNTCDFDTLTVIAWDTGTSISYDTGVTIVHIIEPVPVPLFSTWIATIMVAFVILIGISLGLHSKRIRDSSANNTLR